MLLMRKMTIRADNLGQENSIILNILTQDNLVIVCVYSFSDGFIHEKGTRSLEYSHSRVRG